MRGRLDDRDEITGPGMGQGAGDFEVCWPLFRAIVCFLLNETFIKSGLPSLLFQFFCSDTEFIQWI